jgi:hypothetical protein
MIPTHQEAKKLLWLYTTFSDDKKIQVLTQFEALVEAFPDKRHHNGGYTDLWLTAIADVRDGASPWLQSNYSAIWRLS